MIRLWCTQVLAIIRLEMKKTFFARRGLWVYLLAFAPLVLFVSHSVAMGHHRDQLRTNRAGPSDHPRGLQRHPARDDPRRGHREARPALLPVGRVHRAASRTSGGSGPTGGIRTARAKFSSTSKMASSRGSTGTSWTRCPRSR